MKKFFMHHVPSAANTSWLTIQFWAFQKLVQKIEIKNNNNNKKKTLFALFSQFPLQCCQCHLERRKSVCEREETLSWSARWWMGNLVRLCSGPVSRRTCWCRVERRWWRHQTDVWGCGTSAATWWGRTAARRPPTTASTSNAERHRFKLMCSVSVPHQGHPGLHSAQQQVHLLFVYIYIYIFGLDAPKRCLCVVLLLRLFWLQCMKH